ncbi:MAG: hypothetical protein AAF843_20930, partial [Bacteroidota bacterium]
YRKAKSVGRDPDTLSREEKVLIGKWVKVKEKSLQTNRERYHKQISHHYLRRIERGTQSLPHINNRSTLNFWHLNMIDSTFEITIPRSPTAYHYHVDYLSDSIFIYTNLKDSIQHYEMRYTGEFLRLPKAF